MPNIIIVTYTVYVIIVHKNKKNNTHKFLNIEK